MTALRPSVGLALVALLAGCGVLERGSGTVVTEERPVGAFTSIELSGSGDVQLRVTGQESVQVRTDDNYLDQARAEVVDGRLVLETDGPMISPTELTWIVTAADLDSVAVSGSGSISAADLDLGRFSAEVSGSGSISATDLELGRFSAELSGSGRITPVGSCEELAVTISGSGEFAGEGFSCSAGDVRVSGSGSMTVDVTDDLTATVDGSGEIRYLGDPQLRATESGSGRIVAVP